MPDHRSARVVVEHPETIRSLAGRAITRPNAMDMQEVTTLATAVIALLEEKAAREILSKQMDGVPC